MPHFLFAVILSFLLLAPTVQAAKINEDGVAPLKALFEKYIDERQKKIEANEDINVVYDGTVNVEPADTHYAVTLPHTSIIHKHDEPKGEHRTEIGMVAINAVPDDKNGHWKMAVALPTPIIRFDQNKKVLSTLEIGQQRASGLWSEEHEAFTQMDARYENITFVMPRKDFKLTIPSASILYNFIEDENGALSGPAEITLQNLMVQNGADSVSTIDSVRLSLELYAYNASELPQVKNPRDMLTHLLSQSGKGIKAGYHIQKAKLIQPDTAEPFIFDDAKMMIEAMNMDTDKATLSAEFVYSGLQRNEAMPETTPSDVQLNLAVNNLPFQQISALTQNSIEGMVSNPSLGKMAGIGFIMKLPSLLSSAGTHITIENNQVRHESYSIDADGKAVADVTAVNSATADANVKVSGMDWLAQNINGETFLANILGKLVEYRDIATMETNEDGEPMHVFTFKMTPQGQMQVNGNSIFSLIARQYVAEPPATADTAE